MKVTYKSPTGSFTADGGSGNAPLKILAVDGLGFVGKNRNSVTYPFMAGQKTLYSRDQIRTITVSLEISSRGDDARQINREVVAASASSGTLEIEHYGAYYIDCAVTSLTGGYGYSNEYQKLVVQFTCDYPYFRGAAAKQPLYATQKNIKRTFQFPLKFSESLNIGVPVENLGDKAVEPVLRLAFGTGAQLEFAGLADESAPLRLEITNETNGGFIGMNLPDAEYSAITIDVAARRIYCDSGELTQYLDDGCYMADFVLVAGTNRITTICSSGTNTVTGAATIAFAQEYYGL